MIKGMTFIGTIYVVGKNMIITNSAFLLKRWIDKENRRKISNGADKWTK